LPRFEGRLELTWTNKQLRLLAHEDGSYEWVPPADYRVAEVRLLDNAGNVGDVRSDRARAKDNLLIRGDALNALTSLAELPEFAREYVGKVKLAYLDPPFNTQQSWLQYDDALEHSVWLTMMRDRLAQIKKLLAPDGSVWVHCDDYEQAHLRVLMDELFGRENFVATVLWERQYGQSNVASISISHDYLIVFARDRERFLKGRNRLPRTAKQDKAYKNPDNDPRGPWKPGGLDARNYYSKGRYPITTPSGRVIEGPPGGAYWRVSEEKLRELDEDGRIWWGKKGDSIPSVKRYLSEVQGVAPKTWWPHEEAGHTDEAKKEIRRLVPEVEPFATPKPERLLHRVVHIASNPGEIVLDCFLGSGTTTAVAHKMGRRWVGIERSGETLETFALPRLTKVVNGKDPGGITEDVGWSSGGGFRVMDVAPSMFEDDQGVVVLAEWAVNGKLAETTAAQLHFDFEPDPPFVGRRGRTRLAVVDGLVSADVVRLLAGALPEEDKLVVCGTAIDPEAGSVLRQLRAGSSVRKIPSSILEEYRQVRWTPQTEEPAVAEASGDGNGTVSADGQPAVEAAEAAVEA
jgi:adenine-specific DNA-methyltransferase